MPALNVTALNPALTRGGGFWREVRVVPETGSTNADLLRRAEAGAAEGLVLVAESQTGGRGRLGRAWVSPPGTSLTFSVLLRAPGVPPGMLGWLPLLAGLATAAAVRRVAGVDARLKWPNDVLAGEAKLAGILAEGRDGAVVVGIGLNVSLSRAELPVPTATSLYLEAPAGERDGWRAGGQPGRRREQVLVTLLDGLARRYVAWRDQPAPGDAVACGLHREYRDRCGTLGREVRVMLPGGQVLEGTATGIDRSGRLEVAGAGGPVVVSAGDVIHVR